MDTIFSQTPRLLISQSKGSNYTNSYSYNPYDSGPGNFSGHLRFNPSTQNIEIFSGTQWTPFNGGFTQINFTEETEKVFRWAESKIREEERLNKLFENYPEIKDMNEKLKIMIALVKEHNDTAE